MIDKQELINLLESEELGFEEFAYDAAGKVILIKIFIQERK